MTQYTKKTAVTSETTIHPPTVPQASNFIDILNAWTWIPVQTVLHDLEIFHNYHVTESRKNVPNAWLIDEIEAYNRPV